MSDLLHAVALSKMAHTLEIRKIASPAAGADFTVTVGNGEDWILHGFRATLTTSAAVANRAPSFTIDNQTDVAIQVAPNVVQAASLATVFSGVADGSFTSASITGGVVTLAFPTIVLATGWRLKSVTNLIDVADQWSNITVFMERLDEPPWREPMIGTAYEAAVHEALQAAEQGIS